MLDFPRLAQDHNIPILTGGHHHCTKGWVQTHCPNCGGTSQWTLGWNLAKGYFRCWRCGPRGTSEVLKRLCPNTPLRDLYEAYGGVTKVLQAPRVRKAGQVSQLTLPNDCGELCKAHREYLIDRGFLPKDLIETWGIKGIGPLGGEWAWRIWIPIFDQDHRLVTYTARAIGKKAKPRYKTLEVEKSIANPKSLLYGEHLVDSGTVFVVEGPIKAWRIGPGAVATFGADWTVEQATRLRHYQRVVIIRDPDPAGQLRFGQLADWLSSSAAEIELVDAETSPDEWSSEQVLDLRRAYS